jgi:16S rRNA (guanine(966)-N(2))-methyltransferase RsmD
MRVIGGEFRSRRLKSLPGQDVRPTPDRMRETLFDVLQTRIQGAVFLDAYAGTGAVGIEALSRGASRAIFIERGRAAIELIRENLDSLGVSGRAQVVHGKATLWIPRVTADIVFLDPPYALENEYGEVLNLLAERRPALVVAQHAMRFQLAQEYSGFERQRVLRQGDNALSFYSLPSGGNHEST